MTKAKRRATDNVEFCGCVTGEEKRDLLADAKALVNPANHSFGRAVVEALASGTPVISLDEGYPSYVLDTGETGCLYQRGATNLADAIKRFERDGVRATAADLAVEADRFSRDRQQEKWQSLVGLST